jgi:tRNA (cytidine/uridine-2'-O-)-methyltransferase
LKRPVLIIGTCYGVSKYRRVDGANSQYVKSFPDEPHAEKSYLEIEFQDEDWLVLKRKQGSKEVLGQFENHLKIPMSANIRSFNIANSVAFIGEAKDRLR